MGEITGAALLEQLEIRHCTQGGLPDPVTAELELYRSQVGDWNARKAEGISLTQQVHPLLKFRSLMMRGRLAQAKAVLAELRDDSAADVTEILLEESRLAATNADWNVCIEKASLALELGPSAVSQLTLRQVRANASFEIGAFSECASDLEVIDSLLELLPKSGAGFYAKALKVKLRARVTGLKEAGLLLGQLWSAEPLNADYLLTLCRVEIDLARLEQRPSLAFALAAWRTARHLGDLQYEALAAFDVWSSLDPRSQSRGTCEELVTREAKNFRRVAALLEERANAANPLNPATAPTMTARAIAEHTALDDGPAAFEESSHLYFLERRLLVAFAPWCVREVDPGRPAQVVSLLAGQRKVDKEDFFHRLWGSQKYVPRLHDNLIWNLTSRVRKKLELEIEIRNQAIELRSRIVKVV